MNIANKRRDILRDCMHKRSSRIALLIVVGLSVAVVLLSSMAASPVMRGFSAPVAVGPLQDATPTPAEAPASQAGSTDGIMWMSLVIMAIVLIPILTQKSLWH